MNAVEKLINELIDREGGYVNHPSDKGGPTCWGFTLANMRLLGYKGEPKDFPKELAFKGYKESYFEDTGIDKIYLIYPALGIFLLDSAVNHGQRRPGRWLQEVLNVFNKKQKLWSDLLVDGDIGAKTVTALKAAISYQQPGYPAGASKVIILEAVQDRRGSFYQSIAMNTESQEDFMWGWYWNRIVKLSEECKNASLSTDGS